MSEKYQEEIEEILRGLGEKAPSKRTSGEPARPLDDAPVAARQIPPLGQRRPDQARSWPSITPSKLAIIGLVVFLVGALWLKPLIWVGLGFWVGAYLLFFIKPRPSSQGKVWRGQSLEEEQSPWDKLKSWLKS